MLGTSEDDTPAQAKLRDLQAELTRAHAVRVDKQSVYETVADGPRENIPATVNPSPLREYQTKLSDLRSERAQAIATLTPAHFRVQHLDAQIREMEQLIDKEWTRTLALIRSDYLSALRREALLADSVQAQMVRAGEQAGKRVHYDVLHRELESNAQIYDNILQKAKESAVLGATRPSNVHLLNEVRLPTQPFKPDLRLYGSLGTLSGLFLGLVCAAFKERRESHLIAPGVLPDMAQVRELGVIPSAAIDHETGRRTRMLGDPNPNSARAIMPPAGSFLFSESFHAAVASIIRTQCNGRYPRIITVTSAAPGDGKTTVATYLGVAMADSQRRVVLVEGDLRHPKLSKNFDIVNSWGLTDILQDTNPIEEMPLEALVRPTDKPGLFVLPSGPSSAGVSSLLHSPRLGTLLRTLENHVDVILIDSPPLLAVSDARTLGASSDAVIFVVRAHTTARETFQIAAKQLMEDRTPILGTILNDWDPRRARGTRDPFQYSYSYRQ